MRMTFDIEANAVYLSIEDNIADGSAVQNVIVRRSGQGEIVLDFDAGGPPAGSGDHRSRGARPALSEIWNRDRTTMTKPATVYRLGLEADETYPRVRFDHPRNRGIDWLAIERAIEEVLPSAAPLVDLFLKTTREVDVVDIPGLGYLVSPRLRAVLSTVAGDGVAFAPFAVNGQPYPLLRVLTIVDALDWENSQIRGTVPDDIRAIEVPVWRGDRLTDPLMFQIPQQRPLIWATEGVRQAYENSGCNGFSFWLPGKVI